MFTYDLLAKRLCITMHLQKVDKRKIKSRVKGINDNSSFNYHENKIYDCLFLWDFLATSQIKCIHFLFKLCN